MKRTFYLKWILAFTFLGCSAFLTSLYVNELSGMEEDCSPFSGTSLWIKSLTARGNCTLSFSVTSPVSGVQSIYKCAKLPGMTYQSLWQSEDKDSNQPTGQMEEVLTQCRRRRPKIRYVKVPTILNTSCSGNPCMETKKINWRMVTFVKSVPGNFVYRDVVRRTWAAISFLEGARFYTIFVIGKTDRKAQALIEEEHKRYGDILQLNLNEIYRNVVYKSLAGMQWAVENLSENDYYSSADDDCIVNMGLLQENVEGFKKMVDQQQWSDYPLICMHMKRVDWGPIRMQLSKYNVSFDEYKWPYYPDFCLGGMYTTTVKLAHQLWNLSRIEKPLSMDDVWITGILREKLGMPWQMVVSVNPAVARHDYVYSVRTIETTRKAMVEDWKKVYPKFRHKESCVCDNNMIKVDDVKVIKKPEEAADIW